MKTCFLFSHPKISYVIQIALKLRFVKKIAAIFELKEKMKFNCLT